MFSARDRAATRGAVTATAVLLLLSACGGGKPDAVATGPDVSAIPGTTAPPTAAPASPSGATPASLPTPTPTPSHTATPGQPTPFYVSPDDPDGPSKVGEHLYPSTTGVACGAQGGGHYDLCPVTSRLATRLDSRPTDGAEPLCRCQNSWESSAVTTTATSDPNVVVVHVVLNFGPAVREAIDVRVLRTESGWVADDTSCTGQGAQTSIYAQNPPPCPA